MPTFKATANSMYDAAATKTTIWQWGIGRNADLAEILGFAKRSIINMAREKPHLLPPYIRVSDSYRWRPSVVQQWMDDKSQTGPKAQEATVQPKRGRGRPKK